MTKKTPFDNDGLYTELIAPDKIVIRKSPTVNGYGVFARKRIIKGELIEQSVFDGSGIRTKMPRHITDSLSRMSYPITCHCEYCKQHGNEFSLASGYIMIYNHNDNPNVTMSWNGEQRIVEVRALRDIEIGEEVFHTYGGRYGHFESKSLPSEPKEYFS